MTRVAYLSMAAVCVLTNSHLAAEVLNFRTITVDNSKPRRDVAGEIVDAHDGNLQYFDGRYYLYGTAYGKTAGFSINNRFRVYSSPDLSHWTFGGELLKEPMDGVYYRPYVVFNPKAHKYVLWYNWYPKLWLGRTGAALSDTPEGPFTVASTDVQLSQAKFSPGDGSLFVDDDGTGYFIYTVIDQDHAIRVERLTADYLGSTGEVSEVLGKGSEAPSMFRRQGTYYVVFDACCCFCPGGSGARVFTAKSPLGPFTERGNINRKADGTPIVAAQQTWIAQIPAADGATFVWMGDRWGSRPDGVKGHDFQFWSAPLKFAEDGSILPVENVPTWKAKIAIGNERAVPAKVYTWPKKKDASAPKVDPCSNKAIPADEVDGM